jgi:citrate lyase subunit beta / citryl-CoA lyase
MSAKQARSWMFVPGNRERFIQKANASAADGILLDIEDGVLPNEKAEARRMIASALVEAKSGPRRYVRVNALTTPWLKEDLEAVIVPGLEGICLTKVAKPSDIYEAESVIERLEKQRDLEPGKIRILAAVESARGLMNGVAIADSSPRIVGLMFGAEDYALDLGLGARREKEAAELLFARSQIVNAAAAANVLSIDAGAGGGCSAGTAPRIYFEIHIQSAPVRHDQLDIWTAAGGNRIRAKDRCRLPRGRGARGRVRRHWRAAC